MKPLLACAASLLLASAFARQDEQVVQIVWTAHWIDVPGASKQDYGVYHFRRTFDLSAKADRFMVYVSGDNRYQLFVNGKRVSWGPARGDLTHWRYEAVDIAPELQIGKNVLAAVVWNDGMYKAEAQVTNQTGFVLDAETPEHAIVNTNRSWKCIQDKAYSPQPLPPNQETGYYAAPPNEHFDANQYPWGWEQIHFDDSAWVAAEQLSHAAERDATDSPNRWMLVRRAIPLEEQTPERPLKLRKSDGVSPTENFLTRHSPVTVAAHGKASLLLDQTYLTTAYPELTISKGKDARIDLRYAETLFISKRPINKGNRGDVEERQFYGAFDTYLADGRSRRVYRPLYWRTYRYVQLNVETADEPLVIEDLRAVFTAYPFEKKADFRVGSAPLNEELQRILATGWRTARLCAHETYMDCPYYEQLQYAGDARIQMMISLYMTGDSRLMKNGIALLDSSRTAEGATYSRAPSYLQQYIPPFSLWWIGMVHDYWMYVDDPDFVKEMLPGTRAILTFYGRYQKPNGSLRHMPWWNFVDWVKQWPNGEPPGDADGSSAAALDLQLLLAYNWAVELEKTFGSPALAGEYAAAAERLGATIMATDWDKTRGLFADEPKHRTYSQQVNTLAVLAHILPEPQSRSVLEKTISDMSLAQCSIYFRAYMNAALRQVGLGDKYLDMLGPWREMLAEGLTTWAEWSGSDARSDCHAWGSSPNFELLRTVAGIESIAPGFTRVRIAPNLGKLSEVSAKMPHPKGEIRVRLQRSSDKFVAEIDLPPGITGEFDWRGSPRSLKPGANRLEF
jgi:alpha-L-rhamnosidase